VTDRPANKLFVNNKTFSRQANVGFVGVTPPERSCGIRDTDQTTGNRMAPQQMRSTRKRTSFHIPYSVDPSSVDSMMMKAMLASTWRSRRVRTHRSLRVPVQDSWRWGVL